MLMDVRHTACGRHNRLAEMLIVQLFSTKHSLAFFPFELAEVLHNVWSCFFSEGAAYAFQLCKA